jgi:hypothetical protein
MDLERMAPEKRFPERTDLERTDPAPKAVGARMAAKAPGEMKAVEGRIVTQASRKSWIVARFES